MISWFHSSYVAIIGETKLLKMMQIRASRLKTLHMTGAIWQFCPVLLMLWFTTCDSVEWLVKNGSNCGRIAKHHQTWTSTDSNHLELIISSLIQLTNGLDELLVALSTEVEMFEGAQILKHLPVCWRQNIAKSSSMTSLQMTIWWWWRGGCRLPPLARRGDPWRLPASSRPIPSRRSKNRFPPSRVCTSGCWRPLAAPSSPRPPSRRPKHQKHEHLIPKTQITQSLLARAPARPNWGWFWSAVLRAAIYRGATVSHRGPRTCTANSTSAHKSSPRLGP